MVFGKNTSKSLPVPLSVTPTPEQVQEARLRDSISRALAAAAKEKLPAELALLAPLLLQQARTYLDSSPVSEITAGLQAILSFLDRVGPADRGQLLALVEQVRASLKGPQAVMAAPLLRQGRSWLAHVKEAELQGLLGDLRATVEETLAGAALAA